MALHQCRNMHPRLEAPLGHESVPKQYRQVSQHATDPLLLQTDNFEQNNIFFLLKNKVLEHRSLLSRKRPAPLPYPLENK